MIAQLGFCHERIAFEPSEETLHSRQLPRIPPLAVPPGVGLLIARELPLLGIPLQLAVVPVRQIAEVANRDRAGADLHVAYRLLARLDAVEPVLMMLVRFIERLLARSERILHDVVRPTL